MKLLYLSLFVFTFSLSHAQQSNRNFDISEQGVSRKKIKTINGETFLIQRKSEKQEHKNGDINLVKKDKAGNVLWSKFYGGPGYEYVGSLTKTKDESILMIGTTSSFGKGNNDLYLIKIDQEGNELWSKTYGGFFNEYGKYVKELPNGNLLIKGQQQFCKGDNVGSGCREELWIFETDKMGREVAKS